MAVLVTLAGFFAAHAVWSVSDGETLIPIIAYVDSTGQRHMFRVETERLEEAVAQGREWLKRNPEKATHAVLVFDGFISLPAGKTDALILEAVSYGKDPRSLIISVPYRGAQAPGGFAVHRPKFQPRDPETIDAEQVGKDFFAGVHEHSQGAEIWSAHLDESR